MKSGSSYLSSSNTRLHFGLAGESIVDIEIRWPSGLIENLADVATGQILTVKEGGAAGERVSEWVLSGLMGELHLATLPPTKTGMTGALRVRVVAHSEGPCAVQFDKRDSAYLRLFDKRPKPR